MTKEAKPVVSHSHPVEDDFNWSLDADWMPVEKKIGNFLVAVRSTDASSSLFAHKILRTQIDRWAAEQKHILREMGVHHHESIKAMEQSRVDLEKEIEEERERERIMLKGKSCLRISQVV